MYHRARPTATILPSTHRNNKPSSVLQVAQNQIDSSHHSNCCEHQDAVGVAIEPQDIIPDLQSTLPSDARGLKRPMSYVLPKPTPQPVDISSSILVDFAPQSNDRSSPRTRSKRRRRENASNRKSDENNRTSLSPDESGSVSLSIDTANGRHRLSIKTDDAEYLFPERRRRVSRVPSPYSSDTSDVPFLSPDTIAKYRALNRAVEATLAKEWQPVSSDSPPPLSLHDVQPTAKHPSNDEADSCKIVHQRKAADEINLTSSTSSPLISTNYSVAICSPWDEIDPTDQGLSKGNSISNPISLMSDDESDCEVLTEWDPYDETGELHDLVRSRQSPYLGDVTVKREPSASCQASLNSTLKLQTSLKPWLSNEMRRLLKYYSESRSQAGDMNNVTLHVDLTLKEQEALTSTLSDFPNCRHIVPSQAILSRFPDRSSEDVSSFIAEYSSRKYQDGQTAQLCNTRIVSVRPHERRVARRQLHKGLLQSREAGHGRLQGYFETALPSLIKAHRVFQGTSGDVNAAAFSPDGGHLAIGCVASNDDYNRAGNLSLMRTGHDGTPSHCQVLDAKNGFNNRYPTIACLAYVREGAYLLAGGTDPGIKVYSHRGTLLHDQSRKNRICTHDLSTSDHYKDVVVSCHGSGHLDLHRVLDDGSSATSCISHKELVAPATAVFNDIYRHLVVGYQNKSTNLIGGQASIIDVETRKELKVITGDLSYAHIAIERSGYWVAGTNSSDSGVVSIYDPRVQHAAKSFHCDQKDINVVSMMDNYVTSAATDGTCLVWDARKSVSGTPLHVLRHGTPKQAYGTDDLCGITGTAFFTSSSFITGSSDGCVKLWNLNLGQPHVRDIMETDSPITTLVLSPAKDQILIGENVGTAHLWSIVGDGRLEPIEEHRTRND